MCDDVAEQLVMGETGSKIKVRLQACFESYDKVLLVSMIMAEMIE